MKFGVLGWRDTFLILDLSFDILDGVKKYIMVGENKSILCT